MPSTIEDIKARLDLVDLVQSYLRLQKSGVNYKANCPFHNEKTPSFVVSPVRQIWHCFGCGKGGSHLDFVMEIEALEFRDALELLAKRAGIQLRREDPKLKSERTRLYQLLEEASEIFQKTLHTSKNPAVRISPPLAYLKNRGLNDETIEQWRIGYAPDSWDFLARSLKEKGYREAEIEKAGLAIHSEQGSYYDRFRNRIIFPIFDFSGRVVGFGGRIFDQLPPSAKEKTAGENAKAAEATGAKYINTPQTLIYDKSRVLFGFNKAKEAIRQTNSVVLVEGYMDCVMSHQAGVLNAVAISGTALSVEQLRMIKRLTETIISSFDRDDAGERATKRSLELAAAFEFERKVATLPRGFKDPAEAAAKDSKIWQDAVAQAKPIVQFYLESACAKFDPKEASGKRAIAKEVLPEIKTLASEVEKAHWIQELAKAIAIDEEALWRELGKIKSSGENQPSTLVLPNTHPGKNRRIQLESLVLGTLILNPEQHRELGIIPRHAFLDERHLQILDILEHGIRENIREHTELLKSVPEELQELTRYLAFQAEVLLERIENAKERASELVLYMRELEREWTRDKLRTLTEDIAKAESTGDSAKLKTLIMEFRTIAAKKD